VQPNAFAHELTTAYRAPSRPPSPHLPHPGTQQREAVSGRARNATATHHQWRLGSRQRQQLLSSKVRQRPAATTDGPSPCRSTGTGRGKGARPWARHGHNGVRGTDLVHRNNGPSRCTSDSTSTSACPRSHYALCTTSGAPRRLPHWGCHDHKVEVLGGGAHVLCAPAKHLPAALHQALHAGRPPTARGDSNGQQRGGVSHFTLSLRARRRRQGGGALAARPGASTNLDEGGVLNQGNVRVPAGPDHCQVDGTPALSGPSASDE
jgi:hypothetical protein